MTQEEFDNLQEGDEIMLVDDIEKVAGEKWDSLSKDIYTKNTVYNVDIKETYGEWVAVQLTNNKERGHGWPMNRWQLVKNIAEPIDIYAKFGMIKQGDKDE